MIILPELPETYPIPELLPVYKVVDAKVSSDELLPYYYEEDLDEATRDANDVGGKVIRDMIRPDTVRVVFSGLSGTIFDESFSDVGEAIRYAKRLAVGVEGLYRRRVPQTSYVLAYWSVGDYSFEIIA